MTITLEHDEELPYTVLVTYSNSWTWEQFHAVGKAFRVMALSAGRPLAVVADIRNTVLPPVGFAEHIRSTLQSHTFNEWMELVVYITRRDPDIVMLINAAYQRYATPHNRFGFAGTLDEARTMILEYRATYVNS